MTSKLEQEAPGSPGKWLRRGLMLAALPTGVLMAAGTASAADYSGPVIGFGGLCLDVQGANSTNFTPVQVYGCNGTGAQAWTEAGSDNTVHALGKCLDVGGGQTYNGATVDLYDCNGTGAQVWIPQSNGALYNPQSNKCLDDTGWSTNWGTQTQIWDCTGGANQSWGSGQSQGRDGVQDPMARSGVQG